MGLRPARTIRILQGQPWTRVSNRKPRKSYVKGVPNTKIRQFNMGSKIKFETDTLMVANEDVQVRDNAIEAARQAANKVLEKALIANYSMKILKYPHFVIREHTNLGVAGADRISKGMKLAFGRPKGRMVRIRAGESLFKASTLSKDLPVVRKAFDRARLKLSGSYKYEYKNAAN